MKKQKKIGIITFHKAINYGGVLQCYALQRKLSEMNYDVEIINYNSNDVYKIYRLFYIGKFNFLKTPVKFLLNLYFYKTNKKKKEYFDKFLNKNIKMSEEINSKEELKKLSGKYDAVISGSDQVWNKSLTLNDYNVYDLSSIEHDFKISYAASLGNDLVSKEESHYYNELIKSYKHVSVRENSLKHLLNGNVATVLDPVFLLTKNDWESFIKDVPSKKEKYIFAFSLQKNDKLDNIIKQLSKNEKVYYYSKIPKFRKNIEEKYLMSPIEFIKMISEASLVVTNSFHCLALAIIFNKPFISVLHKDKSSRQVDLLKMLKLDNRIYNDNLNEIIDSNIDYDNVNDILRVELGKSISFLENALKDLDR